jgi:hypothetical protein
MATKESGAYLAHNGRTDPNHPGLFVCSRCGLMFNADGMTVDSEGAAFEHPGDCTKKPVPKAVEAVVPLEMPPPEEPPPPPQEPWNPDPATVNEWGGKKKKKK